MDPLDRGLRRIETKASLTAAAFNPAKEKRSTKVISPP